MKLHYYTFFLKYIDHPSKTNWRQKCTRHATRTFFMTWTMDHINFLLRLACCSKWWNWILPDVQFKKRPRRRSHTLSKVIILSINHHYRIFFLETKLFFKFWWEWIFNFDIVHQFLPSIESDLSGNTVWLQASSFQKLAKLIIFGIFVHSNRKHSSLRSHCWMRLLGQFSNTLHSVHLHHYSAFKEKNHEELFRAIKIPKFFFGQP